MSDETPTTTESPPEAAPATTVPVAYEDASRLLTSGGTAQLALFSNVHRDPVRLDGVLKDPLRFREAMATLYAVVGSDYRYVPKDRTAYLAYLRVKRESTTLNVRQSQQAFFEWALRNDPLAFILLDPVVTVHPDQVFFEVFSKDEGTYAKLGIDLGAIELEHPPACGTTNIDFSPALFAGVEQMRSYRQTRLSVGKEAVALTTTSAVKVLEKKVQVPDSWLRGFLQVQSAAALPRDAFRLSAIDLYNLLRHLRMNGDRKGRRRGLRIELIPGEPPRLVLEPWETVLSSTAGPYRGKASRVVRLWGRRRLLLLRRLLPFVEAIDVHVLGSGLPSFWVLRAGPVTLTLGLSGFTATNWSQAVSFDLLLPRKVHGGEALERVLRHLATVWVADSKQLSSATGLKGEALVEGLQAGCQQGKLMYDVAGDVYRLRALTEAPLDMGRLEYRNQRERSAHDLLARRGAVQIVSENRIAGTGLELTGKVMAAEDRREYRPQMLLNDEGQVSKAECTCTFFRKQGLKAGPCAHLVALRLAYGEQEARRAREAGPREGVTVETRTYSRRDEEGADVVQVTLDRSRLKLRWGRAGKAMRLQVLRFNTADEARAAYFARLGDLGARGYLDATAE
ncbi:MAG TPA: SWIM zinc finger family protein [Gemmataceae bacterium]|nr:SWIM zinc finger family protein [Gemmataceae bacterium]